jgi:hypothetical protein
VTEPDRVSRRVEIATAVLLSVAGLASAWASYQASLWGGEQASHYAQGNAKNTEASRLAIIDGQLVGQDMVVFMAWFEAAADGDEKRKLFFERRFSPELNAKFLPWRANFPDDIANAVPKPDAPRYIPRTDHAEGREARRLQAAAAAEFAAGDEANAHGDRFIATTVILSTVLFLGGIAALFRHNGVRLAVLALASVLAVGALLFMATLPLKTL